MIPAEERLRVVCLDDKKKAFTYIHFMRNHIEKRRGTRLSVADFHILQGWMEALNSMEWWLLGDEHRKGHSGSDLEFEEEWKGLDEAV